MKNTCVNEEGSKKADICISLKKADFLNGMQTSTGKCKVIDEIKVLLHQ